MQIRTSLLTSFVTCSFMVSQPALGQSANLDFNDGVKGWRTVLDGVMGGRSSGRISQPEEGILRFSGELSLENNGGFSQIQTSFPTGTFAEKSGLRIRVRGDGRTYQLDVRCSDVRLMAGAFQSEFQTKDGEWLNIDVPFQDFTLNNFGRRVSNPPSLKPQNVESVGFTLSDKKAGPFRLEVDFIEGLGAASSQPQAAAATGNDLGSVAQGAGLTTLLALVGASGLELPAEGRLTIFAPTNDAFAALPAETVAFLKTAEGRPTLQAVLKHHILTDSIESAALLDRRGIIALSGQTLDIDPQALTVDGAKLLTTDVSFNRGVVHVIDRVMMPETRSITEIISSDPRLSTLFNVVAAAGLDSQLGDENSGPWTVLAPSNEAFAALPKGALEALAADQPKLISVLAGHVIPSSIRRSELLSQGSARTLMGQSTVKFALKNGEITINQARIITADIEAANGVIHVIDQVLLPTEASHTREVAQAQPTVAVPQLIELAIERGAPLFNAGQQGACAAIYEVTITSLINLAPEEIGDQGVLALSAALRQGQAEKSATERAWLYRRAMDQIYTAVGEKARN